MQLSCFYLFVCCDDVVTVVSRYYLVVYTKNISQKIDIIWSRVITLWWLLLPPPLAFTTFLVIKRSQEEASKVRFFSFVVKRYFIQRS